MGVEHRTRTVGFLLGFIILGIFLFLGLGFYLPSSSWIILFLHFYWYCYTVSFTGFKFNFRGFKGLKIHLVALSWVLTTVFLPLSLSGQSLNEFSLVYGLQRYLFVLVATLPFEIRDLKLDDPNLRLGPKMGDSKTQWLGGYFCCFLFFGDIPFHFFKFFVGFWHAILLMGFVLKSKVNQSKYFSSFWVEGVPILWLFLKYITI